MEQELTKKIDSLIELVYDLQKVNSDLVYRISILESELTHSTNPTPKRVWQTPDEAAKTLELNSARVLHNFRRNGALKPKRHFRNGAQPGSKVPRWQYNIPNCQAFFEKRI